MTECGTEGPFRSTSISEEATDSLKLLIPTEGKRGRSRIRTKTGLTPQSTSKLRSLIRWTRKNPSTDLAGRSRKRRSATPLFTSWRRTQRILWDHPGWTLAPLPTCPCIRRPRNKPRHLETLYMCLDRIAAIVGKVWMNRQRIVCWVNRECQTSQTAAWASSISTKRSPMSKD